MGTGEDALQWVLATYGPVETHTSLNFENYAGGIVSATCVDTGGQHAFLIVGYGVDNVNGTQVPYWKLRNTYGSEWGDKGYVKMLRNYRSDNYTVVRPNLRLSAAAARSAGSSEDENLLTTSQSRSSCAHPSSVPYAALCCTHNAGGGERHHVVEVALQGPD